MTSRFRNLSVLMSASMLAIFSLQAQNPGGVMDIPALKSHLNDTIGFLSSEEQRQIDDRLKAFEKKTGSQIFILIVSSTDIEPIEDYAQRVFEAYKPGRKGVDDGVLFVIAAQDRRMRIHTGYGVEGALPDAICKRILDRLVAPAFREERPAQGVNNALDAMMAAIEKEPLPAAVTSRWQSSTFFDHVGWFIGGLASLLAAIILPFRRRGWGIIALILNSLIWIPILVLLPEIVEAPEYVQNICIVLGVFAGFVSIGHLIMTIDTGSSGGSGSGSSSSYDSSNSGSSDSSSSSSSGSTGGGGDSGGGGASSSW